MFKARRIANPTVSGWLADHAVLTEGERIRAVVPQRELPRDVGSTHRVHDLGDVSLLPGLVDVHAHMHCSATPDAYHLVTTESHEALLLRSAANVRAALMSGVTTLRDIGSKNEIAFPIRDAVRRGVVAGPAPRPDRHPDHDDGGPLLDVRDRGRHASTRSSPRCGGRRSSAPTASR